MRVGKRSWNSFVIILRAKNGYDELIVDGFLDLKIHASVIHKLDNEFGKGLGGDEG
jgi:hypothetical protein